MKFAEYSVTRPITVLMAVISILVLGVISLDRLPLALMPDFSSSSLSVNVSYPSSSPSEVERDISRPLEEVLSTLNYLDTITSTSSSSGSNVRLSFRDGTNMDLVALEVRDRLDQVRNRLPDEVERISIRRWQSNDSPVFNFSVAWNGDRREFFTFMEEILRPHLERVNGVANVEIRGLDVKQVIVDLDLERLQSHGVDLQSLSNQLRNNNVNLSGGFIYDGEKKYTLRTVGEFQDVSEVEEMPLLGGRLRLKDVGTVRYDYPEKTSYSRLNGEESVSVQVFKASTANVVAVCQEVAEELRVLSEESSYGDALTVQVYRDQSRDILSSINDLASAGMFGGLLAAAVLFLFLMKVRSTLVISLAIPVSVVFTFAFMFLLNVIFDAQLTINIVSLMGLMVAVGMLVDASVVVLENIFRHKQERGTSAKQAAISGATEVGVAVLASTATTVSVFLSFIFVDASMASRFTKDFGIAVSVSLIASLVVALTIIPMVSSRIFTGTEKPKQKALVWVTDAYGTFMAFMLRWRFLTLILMGLIAWASFQLLGNIGRDMMPRVSERQASFTVEMERSFGKDEIAGLFERLEKILADRATEFELASVSSRYDVGTSRRGSYRGSLTAYLTEDGTTPTAVITEKIKAALPDVPGVTYKAGRRRHYGGGSMGVEVQLKGEDPGVLELYGDIIRERLETVEGIKDVQTTLETGDDEIHLQVDRQKTEQFGVTPQIVARTISSALSTRATTRLKGDSGEIDVILQMRGGNDVSVREIENIKFENRQGEMIPLYSVIDYSYEKGPMAITREDRKATLSVVGNTGSEQSGMFWMNSAVSAALGDLTLPAGYSWSLGRSWRDFRRSEDDNFFSIIMALILMYIIMASLFESFVHPLTILFTVPFSLIGVAGLFYLTDTSLNSMSYLGILVLFGLVVNNGIIFIDHITNLRRQGFERSAAIIQGGKDRLRPILMTACTSLFGLMPLTLPFIYPEQFGPVEGRALMWAPVSLAVFGGLTTSTFLTLIILPTVYSYMDDLSRAGVWAIRQIIQLPSRLPWKRRPVEA